MRKVIVAIFVFMLILTLLGQYQSFGSRGNEMLTVEILKVDFNEKESLLIEVKVTNISKKNILLDTQPFYLVVNGSKGSDHCILSDGKKFVNYVILKEKGKVSMWNIGGVSNIQYFDQKLREELLIKKNESIFQRLEISKDLYSDFLERVEWEVSVWQAWDFLDEQTKNIDKIKSSIDFTCILIPVVRNHVALLSKDIENKKNISDKRKLRHYLSESAFVTVSF